jgi:YVTN family beta-propeller protein
LGRVLAVGLLCLLCAGAAAAQGSYTLFESGPVRPLALSPDGTTLFVCNIPDARLELFAVTAQGLVHSGSVPVGLEPVAVAARTNGEVWVVNHLSDSVSIVDVATQRVMRTLLVGDEPSDIVFAGAAHDRAFVSAAHRGQNRPGDPQLLDGGVGRSDVWVFDANNLGAALGGTPLALLNLFGDTPRALAVTPDGATVYAAVFQSGNQTTTLPVGQIPQIGPFPTVPAPPPAPGQLATPDVGTIMHEENGTLWRDAAGGIWNNKVPFSLPDHDVFVLDANATPPAQVSVYDHVGTILYNMAVNPVSGVVYVSNTDANNMDRFEGFGTPNLRGELHKARISILSGGATVLTRHLNKHIDYAPAVADASVNQASLGIPTDLAVSADGATLYLAAFGSQSLAIIDTAALALDPNDPNAYQPNAANHVPLSAGGPGGVVIDAANHVLYVYTRFDDGLSVVDPAAKVETSHLTVHSPEPAAITVGRRFLYDTQFSSSNGEAACGVCHVFGDFDSLAWDLGAPPPDGALVENNNPFVKVSSPTGPAVADDTGLTNVDFHPLKGPMTTQTLRGMVHDGPMHWRGDRSGGGFSNRIPNWDGDPNALDTHQAFAKFNPAFVTLLGRASQLAPSDMAAFTEFILKLQQPPNPIRNLDNSLTSSQLNGFTLFVGAPFDAANKNCNGCHTLNPSVGAFGTGGLSSFSAESQHFKVPHLRNQYQKVGMFGRNAMGSVAGHGSPTTDQVRGFGFLHDGSSDSVVSFLQGTFFSFPGGDPQRTDLANFLFVFPSDLAPVVGQQVTLRADNASDPAVTARVSLLMARAGTLYANADRSPNNECDLVVKGRIAGVPRGWWMSSPGVFTSDSSEEPTLSSSDLRALAQTPGQDLTFTCAPPGSGQRMGIDRGGVGESSAPDGILDADQCGDTDADGVDTAADVAATRALLAQISTPAAPGKCNVQGASGSDSSSCDIVDVAVLRRAIAGLAPALSTGCSD